MSTYWCLILWTHSWANVNLLNKSQPQKRDRTIFSPNVLLWARQKADFFSRWLSLYFRWWNLPFIFQSAYFLGPCEKVIKGCEQVFSLSASHPCSPKTSSSTATTGMNKDPGEGCLEYTREFSVTIKWFIISVNKNYHGTVQAKMKVFNMLTINLEKVPPFLVNKMHWVLALNRLRAQECWTQLCVYSTLCFQNQCCAFIYATMFHVHSQHVRRARSAELQEGSFLFALFIRNRDKDSDSSFLITTFMTTFARSAVSKLQRRTEILRYLTLISKHTITAGWSQGSKSTMPSPKVHIVPVILERPGRDRKEPVSKEMATGLLETAGGAAAGVTLPSQ